MSYTIIEKAIVELAKETPDLPYIRGMLETLLEFLDKPVKDQPLPLIAPTPVVQRVPTMQPLDNSEGALLDGLARASLANIKNLAEKSLE